MRPRGLLPFAVVCGLAIEGMPQSSSHAGGQHRVDGRRTYIQDYFWGDFHPKVRGLPTSTPRYSLCIEGDFEAQKAAWAVKALPWLILTDKSHVVRAEGFAVSELDHEVEDLENAIR